MKTLATVVEIVNENTAIVSVARRAACDGCHKNAEGQSCSVCTLLGGKSEARAAARNTAGAAVGDTVELESRTGLVLGYAALVFLVPVLLALVGYFVGRALSGSEGIALAAAGGAFVLCFLCIWLFSRFVIGKRPDIEIVAVAKPAPVPEDAE